MTDIGAIYQPLMDKAAQDVKALGEQAKVIVDETMQMKQTLPQQIIKGTEHIDNLLAPQNALKIDIQL